MQKARSDPSKLTEYDSELRTMAKIMQDIKNETGDTWRPISQFNDIRNMPQYFTDPDKPIEVPSKGFYTKFY